MLATITQLFVHNLINCPSYTLFQALYYCIPFREQLLEYSANYKNPGEAEENLLTCLADLFTQVKKHH
jgi:ubiquitin carboxyl-terminal hydrolase 12/46